MEKSVFDFLDYKEFLNHLAKVKNRGFKKALAEATQCQTAYISHVLNGAGHFNLEQAEAASRFLEMNRDEVHYWLVLVEFGRAGTSQLKKILKEQLIDLREKYLQLKKRVGIQATLSRENQAIYYSHWHYAAVHMAVTVPALRTRAAMGRSLRMGPRRLNQVLEFLESVGLIERRGERQDEWIPGSALLHLEKDSPFIGQHHENWRTRAVQALVEEGQESAVHYSSVVSLSSADVIRLREWITRNISEWIDLVKASSPEEELHSVNIDFFRVG
jgi:uncharacterized protein (TIGR02147 family)